MAEVHARRLRHLLHKKMPSRCGQWLHNALASDDPELIDEIADAITDIETDHGFSFDMRIEYQD